MNRSVLKVNPKEIKPEMFENRKSYEYFMTVFFAMRELEILRKQGCTIFMDGEPLSKNEFFGFNIDDDKTFPRIGTCSSKSGMTVFCGFTMGNKPNTVYVYKKEINDSLKNITYIKPENINKYNVPKVQDYFK